MKKYKLRTDLIADDPNLNGKTITYNDISVTIVNNHGNYITIKLNDITNHNNMKKCQNILEKEIQKILKLNNINDKDEGIIIGLGNRKSTADSLGPLVIDRILVTRHLFKISSASNNKRCISAFSPGVMGNTGIETSDIIESLISKIKPKFIIAIDSLASSSIERINKIIQITDTGIHPGSGVLNNRKELSRKTLGIPVIAIGIPTVVSSAVIAIDTINYMYKHISYMKDNIHTSKLSIIKTENYKDKIKHKELNINERNRIAGLLGTLSENDRYSLFREVLDSVNENLIVTSTEIDFVIEKLAELVASALNNSLHRQIS